MKAESEIPIKALMRNNTDDKVSNSVDKSTQFILNYINSHEADDSCPQESILHGEETQFIAVPV